MAFFQRGYAFMTASKYDQFCKTPNLHPPHPQKLKIDLLLKSNKIRKHVTNFKIPTTLFGVDIIWTKRALFQKPFKKHLVFANFGHFFHNTANEVQITWNVKKTWFGLICKGHATSWASHNFFTCSTSLKDQFHFQVKFISLKVTS